MQRRKDGAVSTGRVHMGIRQRGDAQRQASLECPALGDWSLMGWTARELWWVYSRKGLVCIPNPTASY